MKTEEIMQIVKFCARYDDLSQEFFQELEEKINQLKKQELEKLDELWDKHSEYIGDQLFELQSISCTNVLTERNFKKLISEL